ncbi:MAG: DUF4192 domain-containing protein [Nocardioidaceae bacterium]
MLALLPTALGFHPSDSLVLASLEGPRRRIGMCMRQDLPATCDVESFVDALAQMLASHQVGSVFTVAYTSDAWLAERLLGALAAGLQAAGIGLVDALHANGSRYWSHMCTDKRCCPPTGTAYDVRSSPLMAQAVLEGIEILPDRDALRARLARVEGERARQMTTATRTCLRAISHEVATDPGRGWLRVAAQRVTALVGSVSGDPAVPLSDDDVASLSVWCSVVPVRDVAWAEMTRLDAAAHFRLWAHVSRLVVPPFEPAVLTLAAFAAWLAGDGASAWCAIERAELADSDYPMMGLIRETLWRGVPPSTWEPLGDQVADDGLDVADEPRWRSELLAATVPDQ